jgi:hypothetical protein
VPGWTSIKSDILALITASEDLFLMGLSRGTMLAVSKLIDANEACG